MCAIVGAFRGLIVIPLANFLSGIGLDSMATYVMDWINALYFSILVC